MNNIVKRTNCFINILIFMLKRKANDTLSFTLIECIRIAKNVSKNNK